jgi:hypothetical protein
MPTHLKHQLFGLIACLLMGCSIVFGQAQPHRAIKLDPGSRSFVRIPATGGYLVAGSLGGSNSFNSRVGIAVLDSNLATVDIRRLGTNGSLDISRIIALADGNFAAVGHMYDTISAQGWSILLDAQGFTSQPRYHKARIEDNFLADAVATEDSGFVALGQSMSVLAHARRNLLVKMDVQGDTVWTLQLGSNRVIDGDFALGEIVRAPDGDLVVSGSKWQDSTSSYSIVVFRIRPDGTLRWAQRYPTNWYTIVGGMTMLQGDTLVVAFQIYDTLGGTTLGGVGREVIAAALDANGQVLWANTLLSTGSLYSSSVIRDARGLPVIVGALTGINWSYEAVALGLDRGGKPRWAKTYALDEGSSLSFAETTPSGFMLAGWGNGPVNGSNTHLLAVDAQGNRPPGCGSQPLTVSFQPFPLIGVPFVEYATFRGDSITTPTLARTNTTVANLLICTATSVEAPAGRVSAQLIPNPMRDAAHLLLPEGINPEDAVLTILDMGGRQVDMSPRVTAEGFDLHRNGLAAGLYAYQILHGGQRLAAGKLVLVD